VSGRRILVAPDKFAGTLSAVEAAEAIAAGWRRTAPDDVIDLAPLSDGGPGFVEVLYAAGGSRLQMTVRGPFGEPTTAVVLRAGETAYVESAQACGLALTGGRGAEHATSYGVGEMVRAAIDSEARRVVVGLGGSGTNDGGAGLLAALGARADLPLDRGGAALAGLTRIDVPAVPGVELVAASDVDNPLTGGRGASRVFGPQKGLGDHEVAFLDETLRQLAAAADPSLEAAPGAGAAGGLGYALLLVGAAFRPGFDVVAETIGLADRIATADLVITGEGALDATSAGGKAPVGIAGLAASAGRSCVALAGRVSLSSDQLRAHGFAAAYSLVEAVGEERAFASPADALADLAAHVASWAPA